MTIRRSSIHLVLAAGLILTAAACGDGDRKNRDVAGATPASSVPLTSSTGMDPAGPVAQSPAGTSTRTSDPAPVGVPALTGKPGGPVAQPVPSSTPPTRLAAGPTTDTDPACRPTVLLEATAAALGAPTVTQVEVLGCRAGVARLIAVAGDATMRPGGNQVFLRLEQRAWKVVARVPAATDCGDPELAPAVMGVCAALA
ncbi:hypothetical protein ACQP2C_22640 [Micromonospora zamorensis]|uniref:hypothetical protein n=1 Tax=Micromonospora zamorensis TaxID=709883 RepID=UPI003D97201F